MLGYLSADIICSEKRKTVSFEEQIMSKDKYPSIFSQPNWGYCVYYPSVLKIGEYPRIFPSFSWGIFTHVTRLDQSRASENIWWLIILDICTFFLCCPFVKCFGSCLLFSRITHPLHFWRTVYCWRRATSTVKSTSCCLMRRACTDWIF